MLCRGRIKDVSRTSTAVNNQIRFHVRIRYRVDGRKCTTQCNAYGPMVDLARTRQETGEPVRVLVDPRDADHIVCLELLSIVE